MKKYKTQLLTGFLYIKYVELNLRQCPWCAVFRYQKLIGFIVVNEQTFFSIPVQTATGAQRNISQMSDASCICRDFNTGIQVAVAVFYTFNKVGHVVIEPFTGSFLQRYPLNKICIFLTLRNNLPSIAINHQSSIVSHKSNTMVAAIISAINAGSVIPKHGVSVELE